MAYEPQAPNLSGFYGQIINQLQNRANMELQAPQELDIGTQVVQRLDQELTKERDFEKKMRAEGRTLFTEEMAEEMAVEVGVPPTAFKRAVNRYFNEDEFTKLVDNAMMPQGMKDLAPGEDVDGDGKPDSGLTEQQMATLRATGAEGRDALASHAFPKPVSSSGRQSLRLEGPDAKIREVPVTALAAVDWDQSLLEWDKYPVAGFKQTTTTDPGTKEKVNVSGSGTGVVQKVTGPAATQPGAMVSSFDQLEARDMDLINDSVKTVEQDPVLKQTAVVRSKMGSLRRQLIANIPQGRGPITSQMARVIAGEVGTLAEGDVGRASGDPSLEGRFNRSLQTLLDGKMTKEDAEGFLKIIDIIEEGTDRVREGTLQSIVDTTTQRLVTKNVDPAFVRRAIERNAPTGRAKILGRRPK